MSPKEKAKELINKNWLSVADDAMINPTFERHKRCALTCCDVIIDSYHAIFDDFILLTDKYGGYRNMKKYWEDVKEEIVKCDSTN